MKKVFDYSKVSFGTLNIMFVLHIAITFFMALVLSEMLHLNMLAVAAVLFVLSLFLKLPSGILADVTISDTTYAGEFYDRWIMKLVFGFQSMQKGLMFVQPGIKKQGTVGLLDVGGFIQAQQDPPKFGATATLAGRPLVPDPVMGYMEVDPSKFEQHWLAVQMNPKLLDRDIPKSFESVVVNRIIQLNLNFMDLIAWRGVKDNAAIATALSSGLAPSDNNLIFTNGYIAIMKSLLPSGNLTLTTSGTPAVALTAANIIGKFDAIKAQILGNTDGPAAYNDPNFKWIVSYKTGSLYGDAQKLQTYKGVDPTSAGVKMYDGKPIVEVFGQYDDTIVGAVVSADETSSLWMGLNAADEETQFRVAKLQNNSEKIFVKMLAKFCFQIARETQVWLYTTH